MVVAGQCSGVRGIAASDATLWMRRSRARNGVRDGPIWMAGSAFAHIDLMLALMRHLGGAALTDELASRLVIDQRSSQAGFLIPSHLAARDETVAALESFVRSRLDQVHTLESLAHRCNISPRTLARRTGQAVGLSPMQLVQRIRLNHALDLLRTTHLPLGEIAAAVGGRSGDAAPARQTPHRAIARVAAPRNDTTTGAVEGITGVFGIRRAVRSG
ncbi:helix-turn-helix domain-containing protein [Nocardia sp. CA-120079]|uniref:helix-turn-helix domain-containing protein n=1 Tax=Nocardia sp. CA-120079 TaxID=3239974 RepID=UPI003D9581A8